MQPETLLSKKLSRRSYHISVEIRLKYRNTELFGFLYFAIFRRWHKVFDWIVSNRFGINLVNIFSVWMIGGQHLFSWNFPIHFARPFTQVLILFFLFALVLFIVSFVSRLKPWLWHHISQGSAHACITRFTLFMVFRV